MNVMVAAGYDYPSRHNELFNFAEKGKARRGIACSGDCQECWINHGRCVALTVAKSIENKICILKGLCITSPANHRFKAPIIRGLFFILSGCRELNPV